MQFLVDNADVMADRVDADVQAISRALMSRPQLLLLDEPSLGLSPLLVQAIFDTIRQLKREGTTILFVEQNARLALDVADRAYVMETGRITLEGPTA